jgi:hypothetical protein
MSVGKKQGDENWRDATAEDVFKVLRGEIVRARVREEATQNWVSTDVDGYDLHITGCHRYKFIDSEGSHWSLCQVPVEPAPTRSPKDGCRMLEANEEPMPGDFINWGAGWNKLTATMFPLAVYAPAWYCRPIKEPVESGPPSSIGVTYDPWTDTVSKVVRTDETGKVVEEIVQNVGSEVIEAFSPVVVETRPEPKQHRTPKLTDLADGPVDPLRVYVASVKKERRDALMASIAARPVPKGFRLLGDEPRLASDGYWSQSCKDWLVIGDRVEYANRDKWPAIRFEWPAIGLDAPEPVKHLSQDPASVFGSNPIEVRSIMQIRLPVPASVLGKLGDMLEKHYPGSTMRQVSGYLVFDEPIES